MNEYVELLRDAVDCMRVGLRQSACLASPHDGIPRLNYSSGKFTIDSEYTPKNWRQYQFIGFTLGRLWLIGTLTNDPVILAWAERITDRVAPVVADTSVDMAAIGHDIHYGLCLGYGVTGNEQYLQSAISGCEKLGFYRPEHGAFFQMAKGHTIIVDTAGPMACMLWTAKHEDRYFVEKWISHMNFILREHVREDGSCYQAVTIEDDKTLSHHTIQGYSSEGTWTRGQAWLILTLTHAFEVTRDTRYLDTLKSAIGFYLSQLPDDLIPYYDFDDPDVGQIPRDTCSAAMVTSCLIRLTRYVTDNEYRTVIEKTLTNLINDHLTPGGVLLHGSWGRKKKREAKRYGNDLGTWPGEQGAFPMEDVMPYGNYWFAECLYRELCQDWDLLELVRR